MHPGLHGYVLHPMFENLVVDLRPLLRLEPVFDRFLVALKKRVVNRLRGELLHRNTNDSGF